MDVKKLVPWNWFKKEEEQESRPVAVRQGYPAAGVYAPLAQLHQEIDRLFDTVFRGFGLGGWPLSADEPSAPLAGGMLKPTLDISATDKEYTVSVEVPGVDEKDIHIELVGNTLTIRGEKRQETEEKGKNFYRKERAYGAFQRILSLPGDADQEGIEASFSKGVLTITIPRRAQEEKEGKTIEIRKAA